MSFTKVRCEQCGTESCTTERDSGVLRCYNCRNKNEGRFLLCMILLVVACCAAALIVPPYMEMRTFNKFTTGPRATFWDAVFSELRVITK